MIGKQRFIAQQAAVVIWYRSLKMPARELLSRYRRAPTGQEREQALSRRISTSVGISSFFRADTKWYDKPPDRFSIFLFSFSITVAHTI